MKKYILELFDKTSDLAPRDIVLHLVVAAIIGMFIFLSYRLSHNGSLYSKKFNVSLIMLTVLTATVMTVIGNNIALSLGMVGALSIVRFRTAIKDSRDTVYIFWTIIVGICCGVGDYLVASLGSVLPAGARKTEPPILGLPVVTLDTEFLVADIGSPFRIHSRSRQTRPGSDSVWRLCR